MDLLTLAIPALMAAAIWFRNRARAVIDRWFLMIGLVLNGLRAAVLPPSVNLLDAAWQRPPGLNGPRKAGS